MLSNTWSFVRTFEERKINNKQLLCTTHSVLCFFYFYPKEETQRGLSPYRAFGVHQQQVFGKSIVHAGQDVGARVGGALADQEVPVL